MIRHEACQLSRLYRESHDFTYCKSDNLTGTLATLTGSSLRHVNIYKYHSNGPSDANFLPLGTKNDVCRWERSPNLLTAEKGCMFMRLNRIYASCVSEGW